MKCKIREFQIQRRAEIIAKLKAEREQSYETPEKKEKRMRYIAALLPYMGITANKDYCAMAKEHETVFRLILDEFNIEHKDLSIDEIYTKYSEGDRYGKWTIRNFEAKDSNIFEFSSEDVAYLSGGGSVGWWTMENDKLKYVKTILSWMA